MSAHTKGPWAVHNLRAYVIPAEHLSRPIGAAADKAEDLAHYAQEICALQWPDRHRPEAEVKANARLIASAPELLEALTSIAECCDEEHGVRDYASRQYEIRSIARLAISRATT